MLLIYNLNKFGIEVPEGSDAITQYASGLLRLFYKLLHY